MKKYHKIKTIFKRNPETKYKTLLFGDFAIPEFEYLKYNEWIFTEKVDGTNIRVMFDGDSKFASPYRTWRKIYNQQIQQTSC